ncbi:transmembrane amino acid transporter protein-domain-containing protein [Lobosporangium transversale]|uniref:Transmembrane amino acid transporter protein-domain-containing protein n=1 Tax=Lobosporangium transversale TaxID=64571 RepID=A0A1Y2H417_9FUNG|nr:transmembrane amino acid transporter protein-domain-containing protein [Lobosporangium transversale]ORZ28453.1 transmembrane amino acid transporter protein-domain-containing protein [Lobosporangium transversale]|eukprot:XP_021886138.1 transmembrane amino acid transporter protein-domain-containing protein [Lobosporangium transversale]
MGGWIGVGVLLLTTIMSIYTAMLLMKCLYYNGKYRLHSYQEIGRHAFGRPGLIAVWFFHTSIVLGGPIMYLILAGTEMKGLVTSTDISVKAWIWICAGIIAVPFVALKTLKEVAIMSIFGVLATVVLVAIAVRGSVMDLSNPEYADVRHDTVVPINLPTTIASISICYGGNVVYMHVEEAMRYPKSWNRVVAAALSTCAIFYLATAIPGYLTYGHKVESPILGNLPRDTTTKIGIVVIIIHVILAAPILLTSFALEFERLVDVTVARRGKIMERVYRTVIRLTIIGVCGAIACTVPYFGNFLSLLGALGNCTLIFVLPIICYFKLIGWRHFKWYELAWCAFIVLVGIISAIIGSIDAIKAIHISFVNDRVN